MLLFVCRDEDVSFESLIQERKHIYLCILSEFCSDCLATVFSNASKCNELEDYGTLDIGIIILGDLSTEVRKYLVCSRKLSH
jgi:hypothetical protein